MKHLFFISLISIIGLSACHKDATRSDETIQKQQDEHIDRHNPNHTLPDGANPESATGNTQNVDVDD